MAEFYALPFRDEQCSARGAGLTHHASAPSFVCLECGTQCLIEEVTTDKRVVVIREAECLVDHASIIGSRGGTNTSPIKGAGNTGTHWAYCIQCGVGVEPRHPHFAYGGPAWGAGRVGSPRAQARDKAVWEFMKWHFARIEP